MKRTGNDAAPIRTRRASNVIIGCCQLTFSLRKISVSKLKQYRITVRGALKLIVEPANGR